MSIEILRSSLANTRDGDLMLNPPPTREQVQHAIAQYDALYDELRRQANATHRQEQMLARQNELHDLHYES